MDVQLAAVTSWRDVVEGYDLVDAIDDCTGRWVHGLSDVEVAIIFDGVDVNRVGTFFGELLGEEREEGFAAARGYLDWCWGCG